MNEPPKERREYRAAAGQKSLPEPACSDRYVVALDAALLILEDLDTLRNSNRPVRLAKVIGHVLDAIYAANSGQRS